VSRAAPKMYRPSVPHDPRPMPDPQAVLARLFEISNEPMTLTDLSSNRLLGANPAFAELSGYDRSELVGQRAVDLGIRVDPKVRERYVQRLQVEGRVDDFAVVFRSKEGQ